MLQPTNMWQWQFNQEDNQLLLDIDPTMAFQTAYRKKHLTQEIYQDTDFCVDDAEAYQFFSKKIQQLGQWNTAECVQFALNATAVKRYYKPVLPKSWFFKTNQMAADIGNLTGKSPMTIAVGELVLLYTQAGVGQFLLIECSENASLCMLLDESLLLNDCDQMSQFDVIKVMNDRLFSTMEVKQLKYA